MKTESIARHSIGLQDGDAAYRLAAWREVARTSGDVVMTPEQAEVFVAESRWRRLGPVMVAHVAASDFRLVRNPEAAKRIGLDHVFINHVLSGRVRGVCGRRSMDFSTGDLSVTKLSSPADYMIESIVWTTIVVPRHALEAVMGPMDALDGRTFKAGSPEADLVGAHIEALLALPDPLTEAQAALAGRSCLNILAACFGRRSAVAASPDDQDAATAKAIRRFIDARLSDPDLGWATICREFGLSRSRLYRIMGAQADVSAAIRQLRLVRAHREIAVLKPGSLPLTDIAARFGFAQERSFRRAFRQAFGYSPADLRDTARRGATPALPESGAVIEDWIKDL